MYIEIIYVSRPVISHVKINVHTDKICFDII